jgi:hypothetical protein
MEIREFSSIGVFDGVVADPFPTIFLRDEQEIRRKRQRRTMQV